MIIPCQLKYSGSPWLTRAKRCSVIRRKWSFSSHRTRAASANSRGHYICRARLFGWGMAGSKVFSVIRLRKAVERVLLVYAIRKGIIFPPRSGNTDVTLKPLIITRFGFQWDMLNNAEATLIPRSQNITHFLPYNFVWAPLTTLASVICL